jgi:hypothetical protein
VKPDMTLSVVQTTSSFSTAKSASSPQEEKRTGSQNVNSNQANTSETLPVDTINISSQSRVAISDAKSEDIKRQEANKSSINNVSDAPTSKVQVAYDLNGELITKYMDTSSRLIYQTPSEIMLKLKESALKSDLTVDMKV